MLAVTAVDRLLGQALVFRAFAGAEQSIHTSLLVYKYVRTTSQVLRRGPTLWVTVKRTVSK